MDKKKIFFFLFLCFLFNSTNFVLADESITITTFYPSPSAVFSEFRGTKVAIGDNYYDSTQYCWTGICGTTIDADADLVVEGNVGIGTVTPGFKLTVNGGIWPTQLVVLGSDISTGNTHAAQLGLQTTGAIGTPASLVFFTNQDSTACIQSAQTGAPLSGYLSFATRKTAGPQIEHMRIDEDGNVGIGTQDPTAHLHIFGDAEINLQSDNDPNNYSDIHFDNTLSGGREYIIGNYGPAVGFSEPNSFFIRDNTVGTDRFIILPSGDVGIGTTNPDEKLTVNGIVKATSFIPPSDIRLKENIQLVENALSKIIKLNGVTFTWKENNKKGMGVVAQDVEKVFPEIVETGKATGMKGVNYDSLIAPLIESVKELKAENDDLKQINESLDKRIENLENLINR